MSEHLRRREKSQAANTENMNGIHRMYHLLNAISYDVHLMEKYYYSDVLDLKKALHSMLEIHNTEESIEVLEDKFYDFVKAGHLQNLGKDM